MLVKKSFEAQNALRAAGKTEQVKENQSFTLTSVFIGPVVSPRINW